MPETVIDMIIKRLNLLILAAFLIVCAQTLIAARISARLCRLP